MLCCVSATEKKERRPAQGPNDTSRAAATVTSRISSNLYHETTAKMASAINDALTGTRSSLADTMTAEELDECSLAAVRAVRKQQLQQASASSKVTSTKKGSKDDDAHSVASDSTWTSASQLPSRKETEPPKKASEKPVRVYVDGCFDIMHSGHYNVLRQAKQLGDVLIAGVHSVAEIQRNKGPPVMSDDERVKLVKSCKWVDEVAFDTPYQPSVATLDGVNADFCVHGDDLPVGADGGPHAYYEVEQAGRLQLVKRTEGVSTTDLVGRMLLATSEHLEHRNVSAKDESSDGTQSESHYARDAGSNFLPTSWRIAHFSNARAPTSDDVVVYIDGSWDLFHVGHVDILERVKQLGSFLLVGVHDDATINKVQGRNYPIMNLHERVLNVLSCEYVDDVIIGAPWTVSEDMITTFNVQKVVSVNTSGTELVPHGLDPDPYHLAKSRGIFESVAHSDSLTTDQLVQRIIENREKFVNRNKSREKKELDYITNAKEFVAEVQRPQ